MPIVLDGTQGISTPMYAGSISSNPVTPSVNMKNRIINGNMSIDQRNAGASVTASASTTYTLDRWAYSADAASKFTVQQNAGSVTPPAGYKYYLGVTSSSAYSIPAGQTFLIRQFIEGYNVADLAWGTADAKTVTLSFWAYSSLTGTFGGSLQNAAENRSYPFSYTISSANTWEYKTVTITGDTTGTWQTTNGTGLGVNFSLGTGTSQSGTAGAWVGASRYSVTGATSVVGTNGATFYITGVQLEVGSTATSFDYRPYGTELALCQRYYIRYVNGTGQFFGNGDRYSSTFIQCCIPLQTEMRSSPSLVSTTGSGYYSFAQAGTIHTFNSLTIDGATTSKMAIINNSGDTSATAGQAGSYKSNNASASIAFNAEL